MNILYITYDGLTDPLGQSQILPYMLGLSRLGHRFIVISFEKERRFTEHGSEICQILEQHKIEWKVLPYTATPPVISTLLDLCKARKAAKSITGEHHIDLVHCRSYISALTGLWLKRKRNVPFLFDMRGFWADERVEGRIWNPKNPLYRIIYNYFKRKEREFFRESYHIISLTRAGKEEILKMQIPGVKEDKITIIPCCTDTQLFHPFIDKASLNRMRHDLNIASDVPVISYLGSFGTWYMEEEMMDYFISFSGRHPGAVFLIITQDAPESILSLAAARSIKPDQLRIRPAARKDVPTLLALSTATLFFIRPTFSKKASSPTKMGEALCMGIPVICNDGIGDNTEIVSSMRAGVILKEFSAPAYEDAAARLDEFLKSDLSHTPGKAREFFDLEKGVDRYQEVYEKIICRE